MTEFACEPVWTLWDEVLPLLREHWQEVARFKDIPLNPAIEKYNAMAEVGLFKTYTARDSGELVGYAAYFVAPNMHYQSSLQATQDVIFLRETHRKGMTGYRLIKYADEQLKQIGVEVVYHHVKEKLDFGLLLMRLEYQPVERIWARRL